MNSSASKYQYTAIDYVMLVATILVCLWSWIFVEVDTLQRSYTAQIIVKNVTMVLPWMAALERYGPQAQQLLLVHSVCYVIFFPLAIISVVRKQKSTRINLRSTLVAFGLGCLLVALFLSIYFNLEATFSGAARRGGFGVFVYPWSMPVVACLYVGFVSYLIAVSIVVLFRVFSIKGGND